MKMIMKAEEVAKYLDHSKKPRTNNIHNSLNTNYL